MTIDTFLIPIFFITVGIIVSLDVAGLTLIKSRQFYEHPKSIFWWAFTNAAWHSGLLLVYILTISGLFDFIPLIVKKLPELVEHVAAYIPILAELIMYLALISEALSNHASVLLGLLTLCLVWVIYSNKIISQPSDGAVHELPPLARFFFNFMEIGVRLLLPRSWVDEKNIAIKVHWNLQAALVAVDMLALAALLKSMQVLQSSWSNILILFIVFSCVLICTYCAAIFGSRIYSEAHIDGMGASHKSTREWVLVTLRLVEPYFIFYFALQVLGFLIFGEQIHSVTFFFAAGFLVLALVKHHSLTNIVSAAIAEPSIKKETPAKISGWKIYLQIAESPVTEETPAPIRKIREILIDSWKLSIQFLGWFGLFVKVIFGFAVFLWIKALFIRLISGGNIYPTDKVTVISFESEISFLIATLAFIGALSYVLQISKLMSRIDNFMLVFLPWLIKHSYAFVFIALALFMAAIFPLYDVLVDACQSNQSNCSDSYIVTNIFVDNHRHTLQFGLWLFYLLLLSGITLTINRRWSSEIEEVESDPVKKELFWRIVYGCLCTLAGTVLGFIGFIQSNIAN
ncbi:hypothetical protein [Nitrosomonas sp. sh817]|uniref:hypothetical protein n=1 Tax=Nitrosomonas sp. sh817 TaxID=3070658 RepID=UPI0027DDDE66|nr:hypothetical protein [Nitrosomonas sp. sh817]WMJ09168.1 hypothetical protein RBH92_02915 [Nitrosomonas sp. sh817]